MTEATREGDSCLVCGKRIHTSPSHARKANRRKGGKVIVYRCPEGHGWHVAARSKRSTDQRRQHKLRRMRNL